MELVDTVLNEVENCIKLTYTELYTDIEPNYLEYICNTYYKYRDDKPEKLTDEQIISIISKVRTLGIKNDLCIDSNKLLFEDIDSYKQYKFVSSDGSNIVFAFRTNRVITSIYKTSDISKIVYLIMIKEIKYIIDNIMGMKSLTSDIIGEGYFNYKENMLNRVFSMLPPYIKQYYESKTVEESFTSLLDSEEYKQWLKKGIS